MIISDSKDAYYFSHDSNARNDPKCLKLRRVLGVEGYGIFWILVEMLRESANYRLPCAMIPDISYEARVSDEKVYAVINNFDLFTIEEDHFFSLRLIRSMEILDGKRNKNRINALKRWNNATALQPHSERNAIKGKESKEKEIKANEIKTNNPYGVAFENAWIEWEQHRKEIRKKITPSVAKKQIAFLGGRSESEAIAIINQSIKNGWTGLFELKTNQNGKTHPAELAARNFAERNSGKP